MERRNRICAAVGGALLLGGAAGLTLALCERSIVVWREPATATIRNPSLSSFPDKAIAACLGVGLLLWAFTGPKEAK